MSNLVPSAGAGQVVLFVSTLEGWGWGGSEVLWSKCALRMLESGWRVAFSCQPYTERPKVLSELEAKGAIAFYRYPARKRGLLGRFIKRIQRLQKRRKYGKGLRIRHWLVSRVLETDSRVVCVSLSHAYEALDLVQPVLALEEAGIPVILLSHLAIDFMRLDERTRERLRQVYGAASAAVFVSRRGRETLERQIAMSLPQSYVVHNPCSTSGREIPWPENDKRREYRLAHVGRLYVVHKSQDKLLAALASQRWRSRPWHLTFYGDGPDKKYLKDLTRHYGLESHVTFAGHWKDAEAIWRNEELCVLPSNLEGMPLVLLEASYAGRPAVVTDVGANREWVSDGIAGWIASGISVRSLEATLERAWEARHNWRSMGEAARKYVLEHADPTPEKTLAEIISSVL